MLDFKIRESDEFIKLGQLLKAAGLTDSGAEAKSLILDEQVKVNGQICTQRGKKLYNNDIVDYNGEQIRIIR